ncbi:MAG: hypothetical protein KAI34_08010 [Candidatus Lokiarchaeota archaeon]|nr:hypothetical protein [Candidatus Lokiarchaeota archaeon]
MGLEMEVESIIKKVKVEAKGIKDPNTKLAILSLTKITESMLKRINDLETKLYGR